MQLSAKPSLTDIAHSGCFIRKFSFRKTAIVCQNDSTKDTRIHWKSENEGWLGVSPETDIKSVLSSDSIMSTKGNMLPFLLAAPSTHYKFLMVSPSANNDEIKAAYRRLSKQYHPDSTDLPIEVAAEMFLKLQEAYTVLSSPEKRKLYDWKLAQEMSSKQGDGYIWPYETDRSQRGYGSRQRVQPKSVKDDGGDVELSSQAVTALAFDAFAICVAVISIIYASIIK